MIEKKKKSPLLVILVIIILSLFIILPPVFRAYIPKESPKSEGKTQSNIKILSCEKTSASEDYKIISRTRYKDNIPVQNVITYQKMSMQDVDSSSEENLNIVDSTQIEELEIFKSIADIQITENEEKTIVVINSDLLEANRSNTQLSNYLQREGAQKRFYTNEGYICN